MKTMSEEFIRVATKEINEEIDSITEILNHVIEGNDLDGVYETLLESNKFMKDSMDGNNLNMHQLKQKFEANYANILN